MRRWLAVGVVLLLLCTGSVGCSTGEGEGGQESTGPPTKTFYIRDGGTATSCTDWTNTCDTLPATLQRGATYFISAGTYPGREFNSAGSEPITIKDATANEHGTNTGWQASYAGQAVWTSGLTFSTSGWVFDGSTGGALWSKNPADYGFKINPVNYAVSVYNTSSAISNITLSHITATAPSGDLEKFFLRTNTETKSVNNVTLSHSLLDGWENTIWATSPGLPMEHWLVEYNTLLNGYSSAAYHGEFINNNYSHLDKLTVRYNLFEGQDSGTGCIVVLNGPAGPYYIYGNVFKNVKGGDGCITGVQYPLSGVVYNNTFDHVDNGYGNGDWIGHDVSATVENNLVENGVASIGAHFTGTKDYNAFINATSPPSEPHGFVGPTGAAIPAGLTLPSPFNMDAFGTIRGADGKWDRGAIE